MFGQKLRAFKTRESAKLPERAHRWDAGMDFFFAPEVEKPVLIESGQSAVLQTGLKVEVPRGYMLQIMNKSGVASKRALVTGACVVDEGYTGEIFVNLHNIGQTTQTILPGQKIAQGVFVRIEKPILVEISEDEIYDSQTSRGQGSLGSSGDF